MDNKIIPRELSNVEIKTEQYKKPHYLSSDMPPDEPKVYGYCPDNNLGLGKSFNPIDISDIKRAGIIFQEMHTGGARASSIEAYYVTDFSSFQEVIDRDSKASVHYLNNSVSSINKQKIDSSFSETSVNIIIQAKSIYGDYSLNPQAALTSDAKVLLESPDEFAEVYGTRYVASESRMNAIYVQINFSGVSKSVKKTFSSSLSGSIGYGKLSAKAESKFNREVKTASHQQRLSIKVFSIGGTGVDGLTELVIDNINTQANPLKEVKLGIKGALASFTEESAVPYKFVVSSMRKFGLIKNQSIPYSTERAKLLSEVKEAYDIANLKINIAKDIMNGSHDLLKLKPNWTREELAGDPNAYQEYIDKLRELYFKCKTSKRVPDWWGTYRYGDKELHPVYQKYYKAPIALFGGQWKKNNGEYGWFDRAETLAILNTETEFRDNVVRQMIPDLKIYWFPVWSEGLGLLTTTTVDRIYDENNKVIHNETWTVDSSDSYFSSEPSQEKNLIKWLNSNALYYARNHKSSIYYYFHLHQIKDKAGRQFEIEYCRASYSIKNNKIYNLKIEYNVAEEF